MDKRSLYHDGNVNKRPKVFDPKRNEKFAYYHGIGINGRVTGLQKRTYTKEDIHQLLQNGLGYEDSILCSGHFLSQKWYYVSGNRRTCH